MTPLDDRNWQPATLRERGAAVPFTSPMLAGARARNAERRLDLLVPHPGGARGVYIFALGSLTEFCAPTLHDLRLAERLASLPTLSPATVRQAARAVATEGAAGRQAATAATAVIEVEERRRQGFELALLQILAGEGEAASPTADEQRARQAVQKLASRTGREVAAVQKDIGLLSVLLAGSGLDSIPRPGTAPSRGRCSLLLEALATLRTGVLAWTESAGPRPACAQVVAAAAAMQAAGRLLLASTQKLLDNPEALLNAWAAGPDGVAARLCRPDWLLDGWEQLCLLWQVAETDDQRAASCTEIAALLPPIPAEAEAWLGQAPPALLAQLRAPRAAAPTGGANGQPTSQLVALVARNERIRALAA